MLRRLIAIAAVSRYEVISSTVYVIMIIGKINFQKQGNSSDFIENTDSDAKLNFSGAIAQHIR